MDGRPQMAKDDSDQFDNLFEPFNLKGEPTPVEPQSFPTGETATGSQTAGPGSEAARSVYCGSCGAPNDDGNQHCEECGARLSRTVTPVAPQPMLKTTAGARALVVLSAIVLGVAMLALIINVFGGDDVVVADTSVSTVTTLATLPIGVLTPIRADCTLTLDGFPCEALIDDDPDNRWNATAGGIGAELTFFFAPKVQITEMFLVNVTDEEGFLRNARINGLEIVIDDLTQATFAELDDTNSEPQRIQIRSLGTSSLTITITSAYPGTTFDGKEPFTELALQEIQFFGRTAPEATTP
ncbi:MAG: zinc ribbon domain-containing protein [Acidimicrobiia bacterium]